MEITCFIHDQILRYLSNLEVKNALQQDDVFIFDRGFRDCLEHIEENGYVTKMPEFVLRSQPRQQLTTEQANTSRLVTKIRYVVEAQNGHLKTVWSIFAKVWPTLCVHTLNNDLRIAAALLNKFFARIVADKGKEVEFANLMLAKLHTPNFLHEIMEQFTNSEIKAFQLILDEHFVFPKVEKDDLQLITLGSYQLQQAKSYANAHKKAKMSRFGVPYPCFVCPNDIVRLKFANIIAKMNITEPVLVQTSMTSRFRSGKTHKSYILADAAKDGPDAILGYCCQCRHGLRTVGCCSHVATTIYYLSFARHNGGIRPIAGHVDDFFRYLPLEEEEEEDEDQYEDGDQNIDDEE